MNTTKLNSKTKKALVLYRFLWFFMAPLLRFHKRMKIGYRQRVLKVALPKVDLWIQAASVGESFLVEEILNKLEPQEDLKILVTTNTSQGYDILKKITPTSAKISLNIHYCPFDRPKTMFKAMEMAQPKLMLLIECELWPGMLSACKQNDIPVLVVNGRMTTKSMNGYLRFPTLWQDIGPQHVLGMSEDDTGHFQAVFPKSFVSTMFNIKFDRLLQSKVTNLNEPTLTTIIPEESPFLVLGSIREEEEEMVGAMIGALLAEQPDLIIGLFPRHMERINGWRQILHKANRSCQLRSETDAHVSKGSVILWDTIGELGEGYRRSNATFVGGSLVALGGQNFLEPLSVGVRPVTGPHLSNFQWVGIDIFNHDMVIKVNDWQEAVKALLHELEHQKDRSQIQQNFFSYAQKRSGGTATACDQINTLLAR